MSGCSAECLSAQQHLTTTNITGTAKSSWMTAKRKKNRWSSPSEKNARDLKMPDINLISPAAESVSETATVFCLKCFATKRYPHPWQTQLRSFPTELKTKSWHCSLKP
ncbi:MAG: hypothetical protein IJF27_03005 [Oscillospiraceae bacterium]|nr:hypothetical protein [Oscillospiraceae bacterium]